MSEQQLPQLARHEIALKSQELEAAFMQSNSFKMNLAREISFALQHLSKNSYLASATPESVKNAILNVSLTGLSLNPVLNQAYLVPRKVGGQLVAVLDPSYQGLITKMVDFGVAKKVVAQVVHANDQFDFDESTDSMLMPHKKWYMMGASESGAEIGAYAGLQTPEGDWQYKFLPIHRVNQIMAMSESYKAAVRDNKSSAWTGEHREEMIKKTAVKYLWKYLPKSERIEAIGKAIDESNFAHETTSTVETDKGVVVQPSVNIGKDLAAKAADVARKPLSRADKANAQNIASEPVELKPVVYGASLDELIMILADNFAIMQGQERPDDMADEVLHAIVTYTGISQTELTEFVSAKSKAFKSAEDVAKKATTDQIKTIIKAMADIQ